MSDTKEVQAYQVASGIIIDQQQLLLVQNKRRNGSLDWSTPGGVVDAGEEPLQALQREVIEETSVVASGWSPLLYAVEVEFVGREISLHAQVYQATGYSGELHVDDPDNVVVDGRWVDAAEANTLLDTSPQWVGEPLRHCLDQVFGAQASGATAESGLWKYRVTGTGRDYVTELVDFTG